MTWRFPKTYFNYVEKEVFWIWKWHFSRRKDRDPKFMASEAEWVLPAEERSYAAEEQREEKYYPHDKGHIQCGLFSKAWQMIFTEGLKSSSDFSKVYKKGRSKANRYLVVYVLENGSTINRLGVSVSKKVGNSVYRHYFKRCVKESYRLHEKMFNSGLDIVVLARVG